MEYRWIINPFVVHCKSEICLVWVDFKSDALSALSCRIGTLEIFIFIIIKSYIAVLWVCPKSTCLYPKSDCVMGIL